MHGHEGLPPPSDGMLTALLWQVLRHLMIKRPVTADRTEFFAHAEAFAAMSQLKFVLIEGLPPYSHPYP